MKGGTDKSITTTRDFNISFSVIDRKTINIRDQEDPKKRKNLMTHLT
jgi:hypothetical protein